MSGPPTAAGGRAHGGRAHGGRAHGREPGAHQGVGQGYPFARPPPLADLAAWLAARAA